MKIAGLYPQRVSAGPQGEIEFFEPLGLEYVLGQAPKRHETRLFTFFSSDRNQIIEDIVRYNPDVLAVSSMTPQVNLALEMNHQIRENTLVVSVFGGYHPSAGNLLKDNIEVDCVIQGEGEIEFLRLLSRIEQGDKIPKTIRSNRIPHLDALSDPIRPGFLQQLRNNGLMYPAPSNQTGMASIIYSRGCRFNCNFCCSPNLYGRGVTYRSPKRVVDELKTLNERGINTFLFTDLNITANKGKTLELCEEILASGIKIYWEALSNISTADDFQLLQKMREAGCTKIGWGIESLNGKIMRQIGKDISSTKTYCVLQKSENAGILNAGFYMIGHPYETPDSIRSYSKILSALPLHRIRITVYTPLPGSELYKNGKDFDLNWDDYDTTKLVFNHPCLKQEDVAGFRKELTARFYESPQYLDRRERFLERHPDYKTVFLETR